MYRHGSVYAPIFIAVYNYKCWALSGQSKCLFAKGCIVVDEICARQSCNRIAVQEFIACLVAGSLNVVERISVVLLAKLRGFNPLITPLKARALFVHFSAPRGSKHDGRITLRENHRKIIDVKTTENYRMYEKKTRKTSFGHGNAGHHFWLPEELPSFIDYPI